MAVPKKLCARVLRAGIVATKRKPLYIAWLKFGACAKKKKRNWGGQKRGSLVVVLRGLIVLFIPLWGEGKARQELPASLLPPLSDTYQWGWFLCLCAAVVQAVVQAVV